MLAQLSLAAPRLPGSLVSSLLSLSPALLRTLSTLPVVNEADVQPHDKKYVDRLKITARAGKGGNGCVSFYQGTSRGRHATADGGSGGDGGNVVLRATSNMKSLASVQQLYKAESGHHGTKQRQHGRAGKDIVVLVPVGTVVQRLQHLGDHSTVGGSTAAAVAPTAANAGGQPGQGHEPELPDWLKRWRRPFTGADYNSDSGEDTDTEEPGHAARTELLKWAAGADSEARMAMDQGRQHGSGSTQADSNSSSDSQEAKYELLADLVEDGQEVVVASGGAGGRGNAGVKARVHRPAPSDAERGQPGEVSRLLLELKLLADVGLVGLPNAGKSTLLRALTAAMPRVGNYAFTTLAPQLGVLHGPSPMEEPIVIADIPGLIEGAHENRGLGHNFLRHIERTKAIAYVLDCQSGIGGQPGPKCWDQLALLQTELHAYSPHLSQLPAIVVANKVDLLKQPHATLQALQRRTPLPIVPLSALTQWTLQPASSPTDLSLAGQLTWACNLHLLHFRLAQLLYKAGARQHRPLWDDYNTMQPDMIST